MKKKSTAVFGLFLASPAFALPTMYPPQGRTNLGNLVNATNSTVLADTQNDVTFHVLPPTRFETNISQVSFGANIGFCQEMANLQTTAALLSNKMQELAVNISSKQDEASRLQDQANQKNIEAAQFKVSNTILSQIVDEESAIEDLSMRVDALRKKQMESGDLQVVRELADEIRELRAEIYQRKTDLAAKKSENYADFRAYEKLKSAADLLTLQAESVASELLPLNEKLSQFKETMKRMYSQYAELEGGYGLISYTLPWAANVESLRAANPGLNFQMISTSNVQISAALVTSHLNSENYLKSLPAVLSFNVAGREIPANGELPFPALPEALTANVRLSLIGACPIQKPELFDVQKDQAGLPKFGMSASYQYPVSLSKSLEVSYNLARVYEKVIATHSHGGFFSSSSSRKVTESSWDKDSLSIRWLNEDELAALKPDEKQDIEREVKAQVLARALSLTTNPVGGPASDLELPSLPRHGAQVVAAGISKTCAWYSFYCTAGGWALKFLDASFGTSSAEDSFRRTYDVTVTQKWSDVSAQSRFGAIGN